METPQSTGFILHLTETKFIIQQLNFIKVDMFSEYLSVNIENRLLANMQY